MSIFSPKPKPAHDEMTVAAASTALVATSQAPTIDELAARFRSTHTAITTGIRISIKAQAECGELLEQMQRHIKATLGPGYWGAWVQQNCGVTLRQVQRYIRKAKEFRELTQKAGSEATSVSLLAQRDLQKLDSEPRKSRARRKSNAKG